MKLTISLSMIAKDVSQIIRSCLETVVPFVDEIVVVDTGSSDSTISEIYKAAPAARVYSYTYADFPQSFLRDDPSSLKTPLPGVEWTGKLFLADFAAARQYSLDRCTSDYVLWLDSDDVLVDGDKIRRVIKMMSEQGAEAAMLPYMYGWHQGKNIGRMRRERIVKRTPLLHWMCRVHEILLTTSTRRNFDEVTVVQAFGNHPSKQKVKVPRRNLKILRHWLEDPTAHPEKHFDLSNPLDLDSRLLYYLADEERDVLPDEALKHFRQCYRQSAWFAQKSAAHLGAGLVLEQSTASASEPTDAKITEEKLSEALSEYTLAVANCPWNPDGYFAAARIAYWQKRYDECIEWTERGKQALQNADLNNNESLPHNLYDRQVKPMIFYSYSLMKAERYKDAIAACDAGLAMDSTEPFLIFNRLAAITALKGSAAAT